MISYSAEREFLRQPHFFEPMALSLVALIASIAMPAWPVTSFERPGAIAALLLI
jgi:hypothetical protein